MSKFDQIRNGVTGIPAATRAGIAFPHGACPSCHEIEAELWVGRQKILICITHKCFWKGPLTARVPSAAEIEAQRADWEKLGLEDFAEIQPWLVGRAAKA